MLRKMRDLVRNPLVIRHVNGWATLFWVAMIPVSWMLGWFSLVEYVSALSVYAIVTGHWATWQSARVEVRQMRQEENGNA